MFASIPSLERWKVIVTRGGSRGREKNQFLAETLEAMGRNFVGIETRNLILWSGGVYNSAKLMSGSRYLENEFFDRARRTWFKLSLFEELLCSTDAAVQAVLPDLEAFEQGFLWMDYTVYREILAGVSVEELDFVRRYASRIHNGVVHEKGWGKFVHSSCMGHLHVQYTWKHEYHISLSH